MNRNTLVQTEVHSTYSHVNPMYNSASVFSVMKDTNQQLDKDRIGRVRQFESFVARRKDYLNSLKTLDDNWISGRSKKPSDRSIEVSKNILNSLCYWYHFEGNKKFIYPKVVMGPTTDGGMSLEIRISSRLKAYLNILDDKIDFEVEKDNYFVDDSTTSDEAGKALILLYNTDVHPR